LEGILWILKSGARWQDLPERYPSPATCWRRLQQWTASGVWVIVWQILVKMLDGLGQIDWEQAIGDGTFAPGKKGVKTLASPRRAKAAS
jgi:transposase